MNMTKIYLSLTNGQLVDSEVESKDTQGIIDEVFSGEFFVEEDEKEITILPREHIVKVTVKK